MVAEVKLTGEERHARLRLDDVYDAYKEATLVGRWSKEKECLREIPRYKEKVEEGIRKVIYASLEKKKTVEEIVNESAKLVNEVKKVEEKIEEVVEEKQQVFEEVQNPQANETTVLITEVTTQSDTSDQIDKTEQQCKKCMETCSACTEKDEKLKIRDIEFTKIEKIFKNKSHEMIETVCNECVPKDKTIQDLQKEYDEMKLSYHTVKEAYKTFKSKVKSLDDRLCACQRNTKFLEARFEDKQRVLNQYIDDVAKLKQELADKEKLVNKLQSYHSSSYILQRIFNITPDGKESEKNKKGIASEYHQVLKNFEKYQNRDESILARAEEAAGPCV
ncbi:septation ring formation regulator EzrA-like [Helianthus annuus]|uniref:septation ring formation regulator EzrA-like n=1 Tax=Helianthus annuus TaxID=4232 RepID=UPI0016532897|nr:septation ring formation regulator EzrA-like [Helianthus annuus]